MADSILAGLATTAKQDTGNVSLASIDAKTPALQGGLVPVFLRPATVTALTPPAAISGFATAAKQDTAQTSLTAIAASVATPPLASGAATSVNQTTELASLATIVTNTGAAATQATLAGLRTDAQAGIIVKRQDADTAPVSDGATHVALTNATGRLKVSATPAAYTATVGTITTATSVVAVDIARASNVMITLTGTFAGINATFECSIDGGTTWFAVQVARSNSNTIEGTTGVLGAAPAYAWEASVNAMTNFRVRATAWTSGTGTITIVPGAFATEPIPAIPTHAVTGSGTFTVDSELSPPVAITDALAGTTTTQLAADQMQYNGATYDRVRNNINGVTGDTGAKTTSFNGATQVNYNANGAIITCLLGTVTGTTPTLGMQLQWSPDAGTTWLNYGTPIAAATAVATGNTLTIAIYPAQWEDATSATLAAFTLGSTASKLLTAPLPRTWRIAYTIGGTTPSIAITAAYVNHIN